MAVIAFNKYQGAGNDFIIIDNREGIFNPADHEMINRLCDRRFGIGADGLILLGRDEVNDFRMIYFNADGYESTMCGNGGRCAAAFAIRNGITDNILIFNAIDGQHKAIEEDGLIRLGMNDVNSVQTIGGNYFINTGSPHYVLFRENVGGIDVQAEGRKLRWAEEFAPGGTNVNFAEVSDGGLFVRTYERGVEDETLSCGTGVTASAIASVLAGHFDSAPVAVSTRGGNLQVEFRMTAQGITDVWLCGPATFVFEGTLRAGEQ